MPEWKSKEEYFAWKKKAQKQDVLSDAAEPAPETPTTFSAQEERPVITGNRAKFYRTKTTLVAIIVLLIVVIAAGLYYFLSPSKEQVAYNIYRKEALIVVEELQKISSATEVGITYVDYGKKLGDLNYVVKKFLAQFQEYNKQDNLLSYLAIENINNMHQSLHSHWGFAVNSGNEFILKNTKTYLGKQWLLISQEIIILREVLAEGLGPRKTELRDKFNDTHKEWFVNYSEYKNKISEYLDSELRLAT